MLKMLKFLGEMLPFSFLEPSPQKLQRLWHFSGNIEVFDFSMLSIFNVSPIVAHVDGNVLKIGEMLKMFDFDEPKL